jgi:hypothetical protein
MAPRRALTEEEKEEKNRKLREKRAQEDPQTKAKRVEESRERAKYVREEKTQIGILVPRRDQSRADGAVGTGESLICPIASPYLNTLHIFILSDTSFFTPSRRSL